MTARQKELPLVKFKMPENDFGYTFEQIKKTRRPKSVLTTE